MQPPLVQSIRNGQSRGESSRLLGYGTVVSPYGSTTCDFCEAISKPAKLERETTDRQEEMESGLLPRKHRRLSARNVSIPPEEKWYKRIRIPGVTHRSSPHSNEVHTTKYTIINFIPKNLWEQFHRFANIYFLFIACLNFVPAVEAFGKEVGYIPLLFVLSVTAIKDLFEDYRRYKSDKEVNKRQCRTYDWEVGAFVKKLWQDVRVGDFIELSCDEVIPADILLFHSSESHGICYIETANMDGETNLKQRQVAPGSVEDSSRPDFTPLDFTAELYCEQPHNRIYDFSGYILQPNGNRVPVNRNNLLLRGCVLRNTNSVTGIVVYAGHQTKALLNNSGPRAKRSKLERDINIEIIFLVVLLLALCTIGGIGTSIWTATYVDRNIIFFPYTTDSANPALEGFIRFWTFIILFQVIIPISLYITMEIVKFIQVYLLNWDKEMYYAATDRPLQCRALNINEDLGQISYVFTDKTGTLTENEMVFRCCSIGGINYHHTLEAEFAKGNSPTVSLSSHTATEETDYPKPPEKPLQLDPLLQTNLRDRSLSELCIHDFFVTMAICNTVVVSRNRESEAEGIHITNGVPSLNSIVYEAESPDEAALVEAARSYGYTLVSRSPGHCVILTPTGKQIEYEVLHVLEFDPVRKCMSVIVREKGDTRIILYSKGADSVIYSHLAHRSGLLPEDDGNVLVDNLTRAEATQDHLTIYARLGLRTLCLAMRVLSDEEYNEWMVERHAAELALEGRDKLLFDSACVIEKKLKLLGATGIEDRLQDGVPEAIEGLRKAGLKVLVLTGDKQETAINVAYSSRLVDEEMDVVIINASSMEECREILEAHKQEFDRQEEAQGSQRSNSSSVDSMFSKMVLMRPTCDYNNGHAKALVIDGSTLQFALEPSLKALFLELVKRCRSVVCCRATPLQKAAVVELVKVKLKQMTLAIGDGANDVSMIQKADVGVGIAGREGMQAVMASDFAMGRFKFLERLLLVHGHWCYSRQARMMLYFFYKNVAYATLLFWFQIFNGFTGSTPIDGINLIVFNLLFTSLPIIVVAVTDQDLRADTLLRDKHYYEQGRCSKVYTRWKFFLVMVEALSHSAVVFFTAFGAYYGGVIGLTEFGFVINLTMVLTISLYLAIETLHWTIFNHLALWGSIVFSFLFNYVYTSIDTRQRFMDTYWLTQVTTSRPQFWFVLLLAPVVALSPRVFAKAIKSEFFPSAVQRARIQESTRNKMCMHRKGRRRKEVSDWPVSNSTA